MQGVEDHIYREIAKELSIPTKIIRKIVGYKFKFIKDMIQSGELRGFEDQYLGKFYSTDKTIKRLKSYGCEPKKIIPKDER